MTGAAIVEADLTWTGASFEPGVRVEIDEAGRIGRVGELAETPSLRLERRALLPGFVDAHSHAFQRGLRGLGETFPSTAGSFWTWREAMYELVSSLGPESLHALCVRTFREMRAAGITAVGEFHYVHHLDPARRDWAFDEVVLGAAREVGIRIVLLQVLYLTGGIGQPLSGAQQRFGTDSLGEYLERLDLLAGTLTGSQTLGAVAHSIRAVPLPDLVRLAREADSRGLVLHMHVEEQQREIDECRRALGRGPMKLLLDELELGPRFTAVHCTHTHPEQLARFARTGANLCLCPLTEANLGDGLCSLDAFLQAGGHLSLGSDSNARISMLEEMRWTEYGQRLRTRHRGMCRGADGRVAPVLLRAATEGGARSLGLPAGRIESGSWADLVAIDLDHRALAGHSPATLPETLVFGADCEAIVATCVGGRWQDER